MVLLELVPSADAAQNSVSGTKGINDCFRFLEDAPLPRYRFEFMGEQTEPVTLDLPHLDRAKAEALKAMADAVMDLAMERRNPTTLATKIYDEAGYLLETIDFQNFADAAADTTEPARDVPSQAS